MRAVRAGSPELSRLAAVAVASVACVITTGRMAVACPCYDPGSPSPYSRVWASINQSEWVSSAIAVTPGTPVYFKVTDLDEENPGALPDHDWDTDWGVWYDQGAGTFRCEWDFSYVYEEQPPDYGFNVEATAGVNAIVSRSFGAVGAYLVKARTDDLPPPATWYNDPPCLSSNAVTVVVDYPTPTCAITAPQHGQWLKKGHLPVGNGDEITLAADASEPVAGIEKVSFYVSQNYVDWHLKGEDATAPYTAIWDTDYSNTGDWYVKAVAYSNAGKTAQDVHAVKLFAIDLATAGVPDTQEDSPGAFLHYNVDNDNLNYAGDEHPIPDFAEVSEVANEDDTVRMSMTIDPLPTSGSVVLSRTHARARVWTASQKGTEHQVLVNDNAKTWDMSNAQERADFQARADGLWAEGFGDGAASLTLTLKDPNGVTVGWDALAHTYSAALCGRQPWRDYLQGYDPNERIRFQGDFAGLVHCEWSIMDDVIGVYNCIAWSVGETTVSYDPQDIDRDYGDDDLIFENSDMDAFYSAKKGWSLITAGSAEQRASQAEAMYYPYALDWEYDVEEDPPTTGFHAARKRGCSCGAGQWIMYESKVGEWERIEHVWNQLNGDLYGSPQRFYK